MDEDVPSYEFLRYEEREELRVDSVRIVERTRRALYLYPSLVSRQVSQRGVLLEQLR